MITIGNISMQNLPLAMNLVTRLAANARYVISLKAQALFLHLVMLTLLL